MKRLLFFLLLISFRQGIGQTYVLIPDINFRNCLQTIVPSAMSGGSLDITNTLVTTGTQSLYLSTQNISDLTGIQYFSSLLYLECITNSLSSLPPLPNTLLTLACSNNSLTSLPSLPNTLQNLSCPYNLLTTLPSLPNTLQTLYCHFNSLTALPPLPNTLNTLICSNNNIQCFPVFPSSIFPTSPGPIYSIVIGSNPFTCLPNYLPASMSPILLAYPLCAPGNPNGCPPGIVGISELVSKNSFLLYPNPTNGQFTIESTSDKKQILKLFDLNGKLMFEQDINEKVNIDVTNLNDGIYNLTIKTADKVTNKKLVIVR